MKLKTRHWRLPLRTICITATFLFFALPSPSQAQQAGAIAAKVPTEIAQVLTGGYWKKGDKQGIYRLTVVNISISDNPVTNVFVDWLAIADGASRPELVQSVEIKEVTLNNFPNAFVYMQGDTEGEITLTVTSYDPEKDEERQIWARAKSPGVYETIEPPAAPSGAN